MKKEMSISKDLRNDFINFLEYVINKINIELGVDITYEIHFNSVLIYDVVTRHEIMRFLFNKKDYTCFAFDTDLLRFTVEDGPYYDFLSDILNEII